MNGIKGEIRRVNRRALLIFLVVFFSFFKGFFYGRTRPRAAAAAGRPVAISRERRPTFSLDIFFKAFAFAFASLLVKEKSAWSTEKKKRAKKISRGRLRATRQHYPKPWDANEGAWRRPCTRLFSTFFSFFFLHTALYLIVCLFVVPFCFARPPPPLRDLLNW